MGFVRSVRQVLRRDVILICVVIFCADVTTGTLSPTFSLYAKDLGASLTMIGVLGATVGLTQLFTSMPIGLFSDRHGRKIVLTAGMLMFAASTALFALATHPVLLFPGRVLMGLASVSTFFLGVAYVGDIVTKEERGIAFGLYASAMGLGYGIGPLIGAAIASRSSVAMSYWAASAISLVGAVVAWRGLRTIKPGHDGIPPRRVSLGWNDVRVMLRNPNLMAGSIGNLLTSVSFGGAIVNFAPVYLAQLQVAQPAINSMFSARAFSSTGARLPTGAITSRISSRLVLVAALVLTMVAMFGMTQTRSIPLLGFLLVLEGIAFGTFLTAGQAFVSEHSTPENRGRAIGVYSTAGSMGSTVSPLLLGLVADVWGVQTVFRLAGVLILVGIVVMGVLMVRAPTVQVAEALE